MKINRTLLKIAILFVAINDAGTGATNAAVPLIMKAMPTVAPSLIQLIVTLPALFMALVPVLYAKAVEKMKKRTLLWMGGISFVVGGVAPAFVLNNIWVVLLFRALLGAGCGVLAPMGVDLVVDFFEGKERATMLGFVSGFVGLSGMVFSQLGGYLAGIQWNYVYYTYLVAVLFLAVPVIFLPEPDRQAKIAADTSAHVNTKLNLGVFVISLGFFIFEFAWYIMPTNVAIVVMTQGISPAEIGGLFSAMSIACLIIALTYGPLVRILKTTVLLPVSFLLNGAGSLIIYYGHSMVLFTIGIVLMGFALGLAIPTFMGKVTSLVSYSASAKAIAVAYFFMGMGGFFQPLICNLFGASGIGRPVFFGGGVISLIMIVLIIIADKAFPAATAQELPQAKAVASPAK